MKITADYFEKMVGHPPQNDDLARCNCSKAGELGHFHCGWDEEKNLPRFMGEPFIKDQPKHPVKSSIAIQAVDGQRTYQELFLDQMSRPDDLKGIPLLED